MGETTVRKLYAALAARDGEAMAGCYTAGAVFSDPVFPELHGRDIGDMWRMLTARAEDLVVELESVETDGDYVRAVWHAHYTFSATGRYVHNIGHATFRFERGKIFDHVDRFDFPRWAAQALGMSGKLLGKTAYLRRKVQANAAESLRRFQAR